MGKFLILLALSLAAADKLDRTYIPPPGAKFSGGNPEDLQIPLEFPKGTLEATSEIPSIVQDVGLLRSGHVENTVGPNIRQFIDTTFSWKSPQLYFANISPMTSYKYVSTTSNDYEATKSPLAINQSGVNKFGSQQDETNLHYAVSNTQSTATNPIISQDSVPSLQYHDPMFNVPYVDAKSSKPALTSNIRKYGNQNKENSVFPPKIVNTQNLSMYYNFQDNTPIDRDIIVSSIENPQYFGRNQVPIKNNYQIDGSIQRAQTAPNAKIMDNASNLSKTLEYNQLDSTFPTSIIKVTPNNPTSSVTSIKSRPISSLSNTRIALSSKKPGRERPHAETDRNAVILNYHNVITPERYSYNYDTSNGISANESGTVDNGVRAQGAYSYTGDDGKVYRVVYTADENGFLPRGDHLPLVPVAIQRLIEKSAREKEVGISDDGSYDETKYGHKKYQGAMERYHPDLQGFTNNVMSQFGDYTRKQLGGEYIRRPIKSMPVSKQNEDNRGFKYDTYQLSASMRHQEDNHVVLPSYQGKEAGTIGPKKITSDVTDSKKVHELFDRQQNRNSSWNQEVAKTPEAIIQSKQEERAQSQSTNLDTSEYNAKLWPYDNIPEIIKSYNTHGNENNHANKYDGYLYIIPKNKFIENGNQIINNETDLLNTDHELEIGDDDIITISVPSPNTSTRPNTEVLKTMGSYNNQYVYGNILPIQNNAKQRNDNPKSSNVATTPSNINVQQNEQSDLVFQYKYAIPINSVDSSSIKEYTSIIQKPEGQTGQEYGTSNVVANGFRRPITEVNYSDRSNFGMFPKLYQENPKTSLPDFDNENSASNEVVIQKGIFGSPKPIHDQNSDRSLKPTTKTIIGEDFTGPKRPQTFDPRTGYYY